MAWQPLSAREGWSEPEAPYEDVPDHLKRPLVDWVESAIFPPAADGIEPEAVSQILLVRLRVSTPDGESYWATLKKACIANERVLLCAIDTLLLIRSVSTHTRLLNRILEMGGSVWTVASDGKVLERRLGSAQREAAALAMGPTDEATAELQKAWSSTFRLQADPSDAWDHAIKAVEALAIPLVVPNKAKASLGDVAGSLKGQPERWSFLLPGQNDKGVETLEAMLRLMWPNPDRHRGAEHRDPTQQEAEAVTLLAVTLVQWLRSGALTKVNA